MPPFKSVSKALPRIASRPNLLHNKSPVSSDYNLIRSLSSVASNRAFSSAGFGGICKPSGAEFAARGGYAVFQRRGIFGFGGDGDLNTLSRKHEERQVVGYSPKQVFDVVAAVDLYEDFLPWCQRSEIIRRHPDGNFDAELQIGYKCFIESYMSQVHLDKPNSIKTTSSKNSLFRHLNNVWEFHPGPVPGSCEIHFLVDFKLRSPLYCQIVNVSLKEVVSRLVRSFEDRCRQIYGPGVPVHKKKYGQQ
ncbi:uncharacterized protein LOC127257356 [Andrographis paniculata]|uniref:uncharacterized protein LOC127257356 n=1 Tax=Andrographis paniculata TaxID=175694 RepID=UPI0021E892FA|nr:uncharacterized protein LOC127257356 [Andrographis paniculata]XP_051139697.1 uncharacterized protein LOC127257356 [Andrographis paniculata]